MKKPLISVIIPVYNAERFIRKTIESVLSQSYENIEVLIIDDGSTDSSGKICQEFVKDSRVRYFFNENSGLSFSRQFGISHCEGTYFVTVDADDFVDERYVQNLYETIFMYDGDVCVCSWFNYFNDDKIIERPLATIVPQISVTKRMLENEFVQLGALLTLSDSWNKMYKTSFVRNTKVKFELDSRFNGNDLVFNYKLFLHSPHYCLCNEPLIYHRVSNESMARRPKKWLQIGFFEIINQIYKESKSIGLTLDSQLSMMYYKLQYMVVIDKIEYSSSFLELIKELHIFIDNHRKYVALRKILQMQCDCSCDRLFEFIVKCTEQERILSLCFVSVLLMLKRKMKKNIKRIFRYE